MQDWNRVYIVGCGYLGRRVAARWLAQGMPVAALARSAASADLLRTQGIEPVSGDLDATDTLRELSLTGALLYYFAPPPRDGERDMRLRNLLQSVSSQPVRVVHLSTTGVYGDSGGDWIDEDSPLRPVAARALRRADSEQVLREWGQQTGVPWIILRVPGIYGPGRLPLDRLRAGRPVLREQESGYTNRIHVDDLASACVAAGRSTLRNRVYNACDGHPSTMTHYFNRIAAVFDLPTPPQVTRQQAGELLGEGMLSYLDESRRIGNRRLVEELGVELRYPDLESGLAAIRAETDG